LPDVNGAEQAVQRLAGLQSQQLIKVQDAGRGCGNRRPERLDGRRRYRRRTSDRQQPLREQEVKLREVFADD
jgi:hypothetical protein